MRSSTVCHHAPLSRIRTARDIDIGTLSVRLLVRLSHSGIVLKRLNKSAYDSPIILVSQY